MTETTTPSCPLSGSHDVTRIATIHTSDLATLFRRNFGIDVRYLTNSFNEIGLYHCHDTDLLFFHPRIVGDERMYAQLQQFPWYYAAEKQEYLYARSFIGADHAVLDIGSGCGNFAKSITSRLYKGLELNPSAVATAQQNGIAVVCETIEDHAATHQDEYDVVCAFQVLEHVADVATFLRSALACLKPGGILICAVPAYDSFSRLVPNVSLDLPPHHQTRWTDHALRNVARAYGLEVIDIWHEPLQDVHRLFYSQAVCRHGLCEILGIKPRLPIDTRWHGRAVTIASNLLGRIFSIGLKNEFVRPRGLTVAAVYRKPNR